MKKRLTRDSFSALRETAIVLDEREQRAVKGGDYWSENGVGYYDSNGNYYWTCTSNDSSVGYYSSSGYNSGSNYSSGSGSWISQSTYYNWSGTWPGGWGEGLGYIAADTGNWPPGNPVTVPNGDCVYGVIAEAKRLMLGVDYSLNSISSGYGYTSGSGVNYYSYLDLLETYFEITSFAYEADVQNALNNGLKVATTVLNEAHAVLITGYNNGVYSFYDPVEGRTGSFSSFGAFGHCHILNCVK